MRALPLGHIFPSLRVRKLLFGNNYVLLIASLIVLINSSFCLPVVLKYQHCKIGNSQENVVLACSGTVIFTALLYTIKDSQAFECTHKCFQEKNQHVKDSD